MSSFATDNLVVWSVSLLLTALCINGLMDRRPVLGRTLADPMYIVSDGGCDPSILNGGLMQPLPNYFGLLSLILIRYKNFPIFLLYALVDCHYCEPNRVEEEEEDCT